MQQKKAGLRTIVRVPHFYSCFSPKEDSKSDYDKKQNYLTVKICGGGLMKEAKGNMSALRHLFAIAHTYHGECSDFYQDKEILNGLG